MGQVARAMARALAIPRTLAVHAQTAESVEIDARRSLRSCGLQGRRSQRPGGL